MSLFRGRRRSPPGTPRQPSRSPPESATCCRRRRPRCARWPRSSPTRACTPGCTTQATSSSGRCSARRWRRRRRTSSKRAASDWSRAARRCARRPTGVGITPFRRSPPLLARARARESGRMPVRVVLADDSLLVREALTNILTAAPDVELVAVCADGESLRAAVDEQRPDVVVTDIRMPPGCDDEGIRIAAELRTTHPQTGVVILSQFAEPRYALDLLREGSDGRAYLLKERVHDRCELTAAIDATAHGGSVIDPHVVEILVTQRVHATDSALEELSAREREI